MQNHLTHNPEIQRTVPIMNESSEQPGFIAHLDTFQNTNIAFAVTFKDKSDKINDLQQHTIRQ